MELLFLIKIIYFFVLAVLLAILEIQIEGADGWAANLPTWRPSHEYRMVRVWRKLTGNKELTGYHLFLIIFLLVMVHLPFVWGGYWSWTSELELLGFFMVFVVTWDFLWFVLNPGFSLTDFNAKQVWWHKKWLGKLPLDYYLGWIGSIVLFMPLILIDPIFLPRLLMLLFGNIVFILLLIFIYPHSR